MIEEMRYEKINWKLFALFVALMIAMLLYFDRVIAADAQPPTADEIAGKLVHAMGGMTAWKQTGAVRFNFGVVHPDGTGRAVKHLWDRKNNRDHVEGSQDNKQMVAWIDLSTKKGSAWQDGKKPDGADLDKAMEWAYGRWVNDSYWLIMPFKLFDSGTHLKYEGEKEGYNVLHLDFDHVGLTPGDQYWLYVNKQTNLMDRWEFLLESKDKGDFSWKQWQPYGALTLSNLKTSADGKVSIKFDPLKILDSADPAYFGDQLKTLSD